MNMDTIERKILDAAKRAFLKKGFLETNMAEIAAEVGLTRPAMHYYFRTKERLFQAVFGEILMTFIPKIKDNVTADIPLEVKIENIVDTYLNIFRESPQLPYFLIREINRDAENMVSMAITNNIAELGGSLMDALNKEMEEGRMKKMPLIQTGYTFYGLMMTPFLVHPIGEHIFNIDSLSQDFLESWKKNVVNQMVGLLRP